LPEDIDLNKCYEMENIKFLYEHSVDNKLVSSTLPLVTAYGTRPGSSYGSH